MYKYGPLGQGHNSIDLPVHAKILCAGTMGQQPAQPYLWALVNPLVKHERREFLLAPTGYPNIPNDAQYISSFCLDNWYVCHLFEVNKPLDHD